MVAEAWLSTVPLGSNHFTEDMGSPTLKFRHPTF